MKDKNDVIEWFLNNRPTVSVILNELDHSKTKLMEMEPVVFHDDIKAEFYDLAVQKIAHQITKDLALPLEYVYEIIENKQELIDNLYNKQSH